LALSISDVSWSIFREWLQYFGQVFNREIIAVEPKFTSIDCSNCGNRVKKSLSTRTHICSCGTVLCRDHNAAINILNKGTGGQSETTPPYGVNASGQMTLWLDLETNVAKVAG
jgi:putative transposase